MLTRKMIIGMIVAVLVAMSGHVCGDVTTFGTGELLTENEYVPDEIIVKFKKDASDTIAEELKLKKSAKDVKITASIDALNKKYGIKKFKPIFKNFKAQLKKFENLKRKDKNLLTKKEKHILQRQRRAPKNAKVPALDRIYKLKVELFPGQSLRGAIAAFDNEPDVEYAQPNYIYSVLATPDDTHYSIQWPLNNTGQSYPISSSENTTGTNDCDIDAPEAWDLETDASGIVVAVLDTGVDYTHRDLDDNMWINEGEYNKVTGVDDDENGYIDDVYGYDFINDDGDPADDMGHGTHCAGIIAAETDNGQDIAGICWNGQIMALKWMDSEGWGTCNGAVSAIYYAVNEGADVTSNSWGGEPFQDETMEEAINYAHSQGVLMIAAAGNNNSPLPHYPAFYEHMIAVAATDSDDERASFSNFGDWVDIAAPGVYILSLRAGGTSGGTPYDAYTTIASGTSMACPHVAGACGLLLSYNPTLTNVEVNDILMETVDPIDDGICWSDGRLNVFNMLDEAHPSKGHIDLDKDYYNCDCNIGIFLGDYDLKGANTVDVNITCAGDLEKVWLNETEPNTGVFTGTISTASGDPNSGDGVLQVSHDEIITATYEDANDGTGNPASPNDTAIADCVYPVIYDVNFDEYPIGPDDIVVSFDTNEFTYAHVLYGESCGDPNKTSTLSLGFNHTVKLKEVSPFTDYYFIVEATDLAGNKTTDSNDGNCYHFTTDGPGDINVPADYNTIQEAIDCSWEGGRVLVSAGTYNESIDFKGKGITVCSVDPNDWNVVENTVIYDPCPDKSGVVIFISGEDSDSILAGITVKGGGSTYTCIWISSSSNPTITNCRLTDNGHAIYCIESSPIIRNNKIFGFSYFGIVCDQIGAPIIESNWIYDIVNQEGTASGIAFDNSSSGIIRNNTIFGNDRGIEDYNAIDLEIVNCILWDNDDDLIDCNATYSCIEDCNDVGDANTTHNICDDPCFADADANDFHLDTNSPCFNKGDPNYEPEDGETDIDGDDRVLDGRVDIGADEMTCLSRDDPNYDNWIYWDKPECWCYQRQCRGDADGQKQGSYWVSDNDFDKLKECYYKTEENLPEGCECADFDHQKLGPYWVSLTDLNILKEYFEESEPNVPTCEDCVKVNFWTN